ncbi:MAG TPA: hypothetical protein VMT22_21585 [Terriglobales bacterium]|nr:hypothetical protein [Terriglobales bacterium]
MPKALRGGTDHEPAVSYKNCLISSESFQLGQGSDWIPRYTLCRQNKTVGWNSTPSYHDRLDKVFLTRAEADEFALQEAIRRIDKNSGLSRKIEPGGSYVIIESIAGNRFHD